MLSNVVAVVDRPDPDLDPPRVGRQEHSEAVEWRGHSYSQPPPISPVAQFTNYLVIILIGKISFGAANLNTRMICYFIKMRQ